MKQAAPVRSLQQVWERIAIDKPSERGLIVDMLRVTSSLIEALLLLTIGCLAAKAQPTQPGLSGQQVSPASNTAPATVFPATQSAPGSETNLLLKEIRPDVFELGDVRIDKHLRTVSFPAKLNLIQGAMEYFLVTTWGKTHESILQTDTEPYRIHTAMLLLNAKGAGTNAATGPPGGFISHPPKTRLPGDDIALELKWYADGKEVIKRAEELIFNLETKSVPSAGNWVYNGSRMWEDVFVAEEDGSIVSLITDPSALINNTAPGHDNDAIWSANTNSLPPSNSVVEVTIKLNKSR